jgi:streptomycin 6-kinase
MDFVERFPLDSCILHGDLHHENIIYCSDRGWLAVDPKGLVGPSSFETAIFLLNPIEDLPNLEKFFSRISILHELLNLDPVLLKNFAFLRAVVGFIWDLEEKKAKDVNHWNIWIEILQSFVSRPT